MLVDVEAEAGIISPLEAAALSVRKLQQREWHGMACCFHKELLPLKSSQSKKPLAVAK